MFPLPHRFYVAMSYPAYGHMWNEYMFIKHIRASNEINTFRVRARQNTTPYYPTTYARNASALAARRNCK